MLNVTSYIFIKKTHYVQARSRPVRACTEGAGSYCEFLFSGDEGSDSLDEADEELPETDVTYDPATEAIPVFNKKWGEDNWVGRRIIKSFGDHGDFCGIVHGVDNDENNSDYRLFMVHYFDDPDDGEMMWPEELIQ